MSRAREAAILCVEMLVDEDESLNEWERTFVDTMENKLSNDSYEPTAKQVEKLQQIYEARC